MTTEQETTLEALKTAIQMEIDGKQYYLEASQQSSNELGKKLLTSLAGEEDIHRRKFEEIYNTIRNLKEWPKINFEPDGGQRIRTIFAQMTEKIAGDKKGKDSELDAVQNAMNMENKTFDFYKKQSETETFDAAKQFYLAVAGEEREHYLILLDYFEYLKDPAGWFVTKEHPSLDGG